MAEITVCIKYGIEAWNFLKACNDKTCMMKCKVGDYKLEFTAYDHRPFHVKLVSIEPWCMNYQGPDNPGRNRKSIKEGDKIYKKIIIKCKNREEFRRILDKYQGNEVKQSDLIDYMKTITKYKYIENIKLKETYTEQTRTGVRFGNTYWDEHTLKYKF
ncbi:unnamed protein product [Brachionus calyciflorus]|uniref:Uncharacterized protein n=1 Tax=Brachionus calyciflorus TaxID=104777 RepID=A0A814GUB6_9BILA|nr:unnamed protein product [Brachionus calyciflorus]